MVNIQVESSNWATLECQPTSCTTTSTASWIAKYCPQAYNRSHALQLIKSWVAGCNFRRSRSNAQGRQDLKIMQKHTKTVTQGCTYQKSKTIYQQTLLFIAPMSALIQITCKKLIECIPPLPCPQNYKQAIDHTDLPPSPSQHLSLF